MRTTVLILMLVTLSACQPAADDTEVANKAAEQLVKPVQKAAEMALEYAKSEVKMELKQVSKQAWYVQGAAGTATENEGFISNAGVVITSEGVIVFDALGTPSLAQKLMGLIREKTEQPVKTVVVSHYHADHVYGLQVFKDAGAMIIAPNGAELYLNSENAKNRLEERRVSLFPWVDEKTRLIDPDEYIGAEKTFSLGGLDFKINYLGSAHSDGDLSLYVVQDKVLFSGDVIFEGRVPFVGDADTKHWLETLENMETAELAALVPGHGPAAAEPQQAIVSTKNYLAYIREKLGDAVADFIPFAEVYNATDWSAFEEMPAFEEAHRRNAYQVYLSLEAEGF